MFKRHLIFFFSKTVQKPLAKRQSSKVLVDGLKELKRKRKEKKKKKGKEVRGRRGKVGERGGGERWEGKKTCLALAVLMVV